MNKVLGLLFFLCFFVSLVFPRSIFDIAKDGTPEEIKVAIDAGADVNARAEGGLTPLHGAAANNTNPDVVTALVKAGADVNARAEGGGTPLHGAAFNSTNPDVVLILLKLGANPKTRDIDGETPWDYIQENEALKNTEAYWALNDARYE